ncbi:hypothetical protein [uncultured Tenacibaculum sp.]|uniref:hypothetical protein n=1 Tax=uncultured Tenacibaculum sp. TaxID=174713 RepID=UPI00261A886D|nr:hypothetical protein [uncultured Tenacibaculum sp.]
MKVLNINTIVFILFLSRASLEVVAQKEIDSSFYVTKSLLLSSKKVVYQNKVIYDAFKEIKKLKKRAPDIYYDIDYVPLSLIDNILSYEKNKMEQPRNSYMTGHSFVQTINLKTQEPYSLLNFVEEASLLRALKNDPYINTLKNIDLQKLKKCKSFNKALEILNKRLYKDNHFTPYSYAILNYIPHKNKVLVRLIRTVSSNMTITEYLQLGLKVTPSKLFKEKIKRNKPFFLSTYKTGRLAAQSFYKK